MHWADAHGLMLQATGLDAVLRSPSLVVTIFAPTNSAFQALLSQAGLTQADFLAPQRLDQVRQVRLSSMHCGYPLDAQRLVGQYSSHMTHSRTYKGTV